MFKVRSEEKERRKEGTEGKSFFQNRRARPPLLSLLSVLLLSLFSPTSHTSVPPHCSTTMKSAIALIAALMAAASSAMVVPSPSKSVVTQMRRAIDLTQRANENPSFASEACTLWSTILTNNHDDIALPKEAMSAAHALYASTLTRIGRDKDALIQYETSLGYIDKCEVSVTEIDVRMGLGKSLQRLLRYGQARDTFLEVVSRCTGCEELKSSYSEAVQRAVICCMRLGDAKFALKIIAEFEATTRNRSQDHAVIGMKGAILSLESRSQEDLGKARELLGNASEGSDSILCKWLYIATQEKLTESPSSFNVKSKRDTIQQFAEINNSAFDDPFLVYLDDKLLLHGVLQSLEGADQFYPESFVIPHDLPLLKDTSKQQTDSWILKERSGYGSHGNRIVSAAEVTDGIHISESVLCQRIIHPPMLLDGCKFSLRIYVVYFSEVNVGSGGKLDAEAYISTNGLVKLASVEMDSAGPLEDQYMTNSGRGDGRSAVQYNLSYLKRELDKRDDICYDTVWEQLQNVARLVMERYIALRSDKQPIDVIEGDDTTAAIPINCEYMGGNFVPKILGFDFMLDESAKAWLLEVNRFPGLDARSTMDTDIKTSVVYDAWLAAADRIGLERKIMIDMCPEEYNCYSLIKLIN